jgi:hypothetical protein
MLIYIKSFAFDFVAIGSSSNYNFGWSGSIPEIYLRDNRGSDSKGTATKSSMSFILELLPDLECNTSLSSMVTPILSSLDASAAGFVRPSS